MQAEENVLPAGMPTGGGKVSGGRSGSAVRSRGPSGSARSQAGGGGDGGRAYARHEAKALPHYYLPKPAVGGRAMERRPTRPFYEPAAELLDQHQKYNEHPFLLQKDFQLNRDVGKTCLSFGAIAMPVLLC